MKLFNASNLSPINQRRLQNFIANRRGFWSLWIFLALFFLSLFSEFIANDRPIFVWFKGSIYSPVLTDYSEDNWLGEDPLNLPVTDYKLDIIVEEIESNGFMIWPPVRYSYQTIINQLPEPAPTKPSWLYTHEQRCAGYEFGVEDPQCNLGNWNWFGTDDKARDVFGRVIYGFRISILFALILTGASAVIGIAAGAVQGYFGGWIDMVFQRLIEIWSSTPQLYILLIIAAILPPGFWILLGILLLFSWVGFVGIVRAEFLRARNFEYVKAARALGVGNRSIMFRHLLPNAMVATLTFMPFILSGSVTTLTSLDFLGLGLPPGSASLGELLLQGKNNISSPWLGIAGFLVISIMLSLLVFVGEAVRDAFDPRKAFS